MLFFALSAQVQNLNRRRWRQDCSMFCKRYIIPPSCTIIFHTQCKAALGLMQKLPSCTSLAIHLLAKYNATGIPAVPEKYQPVNQSGRWAFPSVLPGGCAQPIAQEPPPFQRPTRNARSAWPRTATASPLATLVLPQQPALQTESISSFQSTELCLQDVAESLDWLGRV